MLVDTFMFYNEFDVLEMRFRILEPYVDKFVLVEAEVNHVGGPKELFFEKNKERFEKWLNRIEHVIVKADECPKDTNPWSREKYQRECILRGLENVCVSDDNVVMISDVDEIPDLTRIHWEHLPQAVISVHMWMYQYNFKFMFTGEPWVGTVITTYGLVKTNGPNYFRDRRWNFPLVQYAGWHLSSFGDGKHIVNKMKTFAHALDKNDHKQFQTEENINRWIKEGLHLDGMKELTPRPDGAPLPPLPEELLKKFLP
jgi:beta-1,4-mannosyl-glycoprotein beta-1,4-N-acetylglucosaminyltransferase